MSDSKLKDTAAGVLASLSIVSGTPEYQSNTPDQYKNTQEVNDYSDHSETKRDESEQQVSDDINARNNEADRPSDHQDK